jgi:GNAT superfamily N-acetyltransferase
VSRLEIRAFAEDHVDVAGSLLAARHRAHRAVEPLLSERFEDPDAARAEVASLWAQGDASGAVALREGQVVGFLLGTRRNDQTWGANVWIESGGHAVEEAEEIRDLYAAAAGRWVEEGRTRHYVLVPATDAPLVEAWFRLSFGQQHAHGVREVPATIDVQVPDGFAIREPAEADVEALIDVHLALPLHQRSSPVFSDMALSTREESRQEWLETLATREEKILVALRGDRPVACWSVMPVVRSHEYRDLLWPEQACFLGFASTLPQARGSGVGVGLTHAMLDWAREQGYEVMVTDWRATNLLSSRFWPRRGFRPTFLRLYRSIP